MINNQKREVHISYQEKQFQKDLVITKRFLKGNSEIFFTHADKGNQTICMNVLDYQRKMIDLLNDQKTYIILRKNPLPKLKTYVHKLLTRLNNNGYLQKKYHNNQLTQTNTVLPRAYGLPKIHKNNTPLRPIISTIGSPTHFLSKIIYDELKTFIPNHHHMSTTASI